MKINYLQIIGDLRLIADEFRSTQRERIRLMMDLDVADDSVQQGLTVTANCRCKAHLTHINMSWHLVVTMSGGLLTLIEVPLGRHTHSAWALANAADKVEVLIHDMRAYDQHLAVQLGEAPTHSFERRLAEGEMSEISDALEVSDPGPSLHEATSIESTSDQERQPVESVETVEPVQVTLPGLPEQPVPPTPHTQHLRPTRTLSVVAKWKILAEVMQVITVHIPNANPEEELSDDELAEYIGEEDLKHKFTPRLDLMERGALLDEYTEDFSCEINHEGIKHDREITLEPFDD